MDGKTDGQKMDRTKGDQKDNLSFTALVRLKKTSALP